jgi:hypothetical protein
MIMVRVPFPALFVSLLLPATLPAQGASYTIFGSACTTGRLSAQLGPVPFAVRGLPRLGSWFEIVTESSARYPWGNTRSVFLLTGRSNSNLNGLPLPFDISVLQPGSPYCGLLHTSSEVVTRLPSLGDYLASAVVRFDVPNSTALLGVTLYQQVLSIEGSTFGPPHSSMALSAAGRCILGL